MHMMSLGDAGMQGDGANTPQTLKASIERGTLHIFGRQLPLPIRRAQCQSSPSSLQQNMFPASLARKACHCTKGHIQCYSSKQALLTIGTLTAPCAERIRSCCVQGLWRSGRRVLGRLAAGFPQQRQRSSANPCGPIIKHLMRATCRASI